MAAAHHVPVTTRFAFQHARDLIAKDQARAQKMSAGMNAFGPFRHHHKHHDHHHRHHHHGRELDEGDSGSAIGVTDNTVSYTANVMVGQSKKEYTLIVDSGRYSRCALRTIEH